MGRVWRRGGESDETIKRDGGGIRQGMHGEATRLEAIAIRLEATRFSLYLLANEARYFQEREVKPCVLPVACSSFFLFCLCSIVFHDHFNVSCFFHVFPLHFLCVCCSIVLQRGCTLPGIIMVASCCSQSIYTTRSLPKIHSLFSHPGDVDGRALRASEDHELTAGELHFHDTLCHGLPPMV